MTKIFVAGAYNGDNIIECLDNIKRELKVCAYLLSKGYLPFCPWTDFLFHSVSSVDWTPTLEQYQEYCLHLIEISDVVFVISGYNTHEGVIGEVERAKKCNIPVYTYISRYMIDRDPKKLYIKEDELCEDLLECMQEIEGFRMGE